MDEKDFVDMMLENAKKRKVPLQPQKMISPDRDIIQPQRQLSDEEVDEVLDFTDSMRKKMQK